MPISADEESVIRAANKLLTETVWRNIQGFALIFSFRRIASLGLQYSADQITDDWRLLMHALVNDPEYEGILVPIRPGAPKIQDLSSVAGPAAQVEMQNFNLAVDAASLVFAHSILDDAAFQYCRVTAIVSPTSWEAFVIKGKVVLEELRNETYHSILRKKTEDYVNKLERESLLTKCDRLFQICRPSADFKPIRGFSFERDRLANLDKLRHEIVHDTGPADRLPNGDEDLRFMQQCSLYLMSLINNCFGIQIDPRYFPLPSSGDIPR